MAQAGGGGGGGWGTGAVAAPNGGGGGWGVAIVDEEATANINRIYNVDQVPLPFVTYADGSTDGWGRHGGGWGLGEHCDDKPAEILGGVAIVAIVAIVAGSPDLASLSGCQLVSSGCQLLSSECQLIFKIRQYQNISGICTS